MGEDEAVQGLAALGNRTRLQVFRLLVQAGAAGAAVGVLQERLEVPASTLAHHISALVRAGLVEQERQGREVICRANYGAVRALVGYLTESCCIGLSQEAPGRAGREDSHE